MDDAAAEALGATTEKSWLRRLREATAPDPMTWGPMLLGGRAPRVRSAPITPKSVEPLGGVLLDSKTTAAKSAATRSVTENHIQQLDAEIRGLQKKMDEVDAALKTKLTHDEYELWWEYRGTLEHDAAEAYAEYNKLLGSIGR